jgi:prepilin-type N-terminal cleavage/methylation domain-containing protein
MLWLSSVFSKQRPTVPPLAAGFSLVELMISITIMVIVVSIVSTSQGAFNSAVLLRGQAYEAALQIREVQLSAVGAARDGVSSDSVVYGVHFDTNNNQYKTFRDSNSNGFWESGEEYGQQSFLDNRFEIREIRTVGDSMGGTALYNRFEIREIRTPGDSMGGTALSIVFVRPNFDARFFNQNGEVEVSIVEIDIARRGSAGTGSGDVRTLEVTAAGQIAVKPIPN